MGSKTSRGYVFSTPGLIFMLVFKARAGKWTSVTSYVRSWYELACTVLVGAALPPLPKQARVCTLYVGACFSKSCRGRAHATTIRMTCVIQELII